MSSKRKATPSKLCLSPAAAKLPKSGAQHTKPINQLKQSSTPLVAVDLSPSTNYSSAGGSPARTVATAMPHPCSGTSVPELLPSSATPGQVVQWLRDSCFAEVTAADQLAYLDDLLEQLTGLRHRVTSAAVGKQQVSWQTYCFVLIGVVIIIKALYSW